MALALGRPEVISLAAGFTDPETLPVEEAKELLDAMLSEHQSGRAALQYGTTKGDPALRRLTAERVRALDGQPPEAPAYSPDRMIITNGSQQMLYMISEALCDPGDIVLVEDPSYFVFLGILQSHGLEGRGVRLQADGLDLAHLEAILERLKKSGELRRLKLLYLVSYYQNPTGTTTVFEKKLQALQLLERFERSAGHPIYLLEDAAYRELPWTSSQLGESRLRSSRAVRGRERRVIYAGTYSKPFATGARVGFCFLPEPLLTAVLRIKGNHDFGSSNLLQQLLARALGSGAYERHLEVLHRRYAYKAQIMEKGLQAYLPKTAVWQRPEGGLYFWPRLPRRIQTGMKSRLFQAALANEVVYVPGELCYAEDPTRSKPRCEMRLSFAAAPEADITAGLERLGAAVRSVG